MEKENKTDAGKTVEDGLKGSNAPVGRGALWETSKGFSGRLEVEGKAFRVFVGDSQFYREGSRRPQKYLVLWEGE